MLGVRGVGVNEKVWFLYPFTNNIIGEFRT